MHERSEEHTSELQSRENLVCRLLLEKKKTRLSCFSAEDKVQITSGSRSNTFFFNDTATTEIYTLSLHDALPISAALNAKTFGDLRPLMADLPEPVPAPPRPVPHPRWSGPPPWVAYRRGPRLMPLLLLVALVALLANGGGWMMLGLFQVILVFWLVSCVIAAFAVGGYRRRMRRYWQSGHDQRGPR